MNRRPGMAGACEPRSATRICGPREATQAPVRFACALGGLCGLCGNFCSFVFLHFLRFFPIVFPIFVISVGASGSPRSRIIFVFFVMFLVISMILVCRARAAHREADPAATVDVP